MGATRRGPRHHSHRFAHLTHPNPNPNHLQASRCIFPLSLTSVFLNFYHPVLHPPLTCLSCSSDHHQWVCTTKTFLRMYALVCLLKLILPLPLVHIYRKYFSQLVVKDFGGQLWPLGPADPILVLITSDPSTLLVYCGCT